MRAIILNGAGRYADPWHPYAETSARLASLVAEAGYDVEVRDDVDAALATLGGDVALLVVNAGDPDGPVPDAAELGGGVGDVGDRTGDGFNNAWRIARP